LRIEKQIEFLPFFLRQVMGDLHPDHRVINAYEKVKKVTQVRPVGNGPFEHILPGLRRLKKR
jgi:hypothetical protein